MRLYDLKVSRDYIEKRLEKGSWYIKLEAPDILAGVKKLQKMSLEECNKSIAEEEVKFCGLIPVFKSFFTGKNIDVAVEEEPILWVSTRDELKLTLRALVKDVEEKDLDTVIEDLKKTFREHEVYLRVS